MNETQRTNEPNAVSPLWSLRRAGPDDLDAIVLIQRAAYSANRDRLGVEPLPLLIDYSDVIATLEVWIADVPASKEDSSDEVLEPAAILIVDARADTFTVESVAVHPAYQGRGLGAALLTAAELRARSLGFPEVLLYTGRPLTHLVDWYQRSGYAIDRIEALADREIVHLRKPLT